MTAEPSIQERLEALANHPLMKTLLKGEETSYTSPFNFSCRGCGHLCCVDTEVLVSPPEAARIFWHLQRHPKLEAALLRAGIQWGTMFLGGSTGLPVVQLNFVPFDEKKPGAGRHCPFLVPVFGGDSKNPRFMNMAWCGIREARPAACRVYPLGRISIDGDPNLPENWQYRVVTRCPGFEPAGHGDVVPPGYEPADPGQRVKDWITRQIDGEQESERNFYLSEVVTAFMQAHVHALTEDCPDGLLPEKAALSLGLRLLYGPPVAPADPAQDHSVIMRWLTTLRNFVPVIAGAVREAQQAATARPSG